MSTALFRSRVECTTRPSRSGFTLVELLVVIGIIALLISILLPALGNARNEANTIKCASNLRELGNAFRLYATQNRDACPVGVVAGVNTTGSGVNLRLTGTTNAIEAQFNYVMYWRNSNGERATAIGLLAASRVALNGQAFYCPSETNERHMYNTPINGWPYNQKGDVVALPTGFTLGHTRIGYSTRPAAIYPAVDVNADPAGKALTPLFIEGRWTGVASTVYPQRYPTFASLKNRAIASELLISPQQVKNRHKGNMNVLYGSGAVIRVKESILSKEAKLAGGSRPGSTGPTWAGVNATVDPYTVNFADNNIFLPVTPAANVNDKPVWRVLDDQSR